jgi:two-component system, cell cycle sensor histidine kinase and response regulator CckA
MSESIPSEKKMSNQVTLAIDLPHEKRGKGPFVPTSGPSMEEALRMSEIRYRRLFETAQDGILIIDHRSGGIIDVNPFLLYLLGYSHDEFIGKKLWELGAIKDIDANKDRFEMLSENDYIQYNDLPLKTKDGRVIDVEFVSNAYLVGDSKVIQCNIRDITARKKVEKSRHGKEMLQEEHFRQAQKMESLGTLAGGVAHELNNVLAMILPSAEMIAATSGNNTKTAVYADHIIEAANRGAEIVKQMSVFARSGTAEFKPVSLQRIVLEIGSNFSHTIGKDIAVRMEIRTPESIVLGEIDLLHEAVANLAVNAVDAMPKGGTLTLELVDAEDDALCRIFETLDINTIHEHYVTLRICDTGIGFDEKMRERIFEPFFTTKAPGRGTGLGLSIVHGVVKSHRGILEVESAPGKGTNVSVYLPLMQDQESAYACLPARANSSAADVIRKPYGIGEASPVMRRSLQVA